MPRTATAVERKMDKHEPLEGMHFRQKDSFDESDSDAAPSISDSDFGDESDGESTAQEYKKSGSSGGDNTVPAAGNNNKSSSNGRLVVVAASTFLLACPILAEGWV